MCELIALNWESAYGSSPSECTIESASNARPLVSLTRARARARQLYHVRSLHFISRAILLDAHVFQIIFVSTVHAMSNSLSLRPGKLFSALKSEKAANRLSEQCENQTETDPAGRRRERARGDENEEAKREKKVEKSERKKDKNRAAIIVQGTGFPITSVCFADRLIDYRAWCARAAHK